MKDSEKSLYIFLWLEKVSFGVLEAIHHLLSLMMVYIKAPTKYLNNYVIILNCFPSL